MKNANEVISSLIAHVNLYRMSFTAEQPLQDALSNQLDDTIAEAQEYLSARKKQEDKTNEALKPSQT